MSDLFLNLLALSIAGSVVVVLMLLLRPVTVKIFPAKWQYRIGKMAIAFFLIPVSFFVGKLSLARPAIEYYPSEPFIIQKVPPANGLADTMNVVDAVIEEHLSVEVMQVILFIWLIGAIVFAAWHFYCYRRFIKQLRAANTPVPEDGKAFALLSSCQAVLGIHGEVKLMQNRRIASPMLVGLLRPMILLPTSDMQKIDLKLVLIHELMHLKRKDLWIKMFALVAGTLHWFNPFVHILRKDVSTWGELSCDEALATEMSHEERRLYGEAILNTLDIHSGMNTAFCSALGESKKHIERRLTMLLNVKKTKKHIAVFAVAALLAIGGTGMAFSAGSAEKDNDLFNVTVDKQAEEAVIGPTEIKQAIDVNIKSLDIGEFLAVGGPYTLEEGDIIRYNITAEGNGNLNADFRKTEDSDDDQGYLGESGLSGNFMKNATSFIVPKSLPGTYYLWIGNFDGKTLDKNNSNGVLNNIKGTVEIAVESASK